MGECDFCQEISLSLKAVSVYGAELKICPKCIEKARFKVVNFCPYCRGMEWTSFDQGNEEFAICQTPCSECMLRR